MRILDKYIIRNFLSPFFYCLSLFIFLYIIIDLFGHLDEILKYSVPILILQEYYLSMTPFIIIHTAPVASLISTIYAINMMNRHDEIMAMRAAGINMFRILAPFIFIGIVISLSVFTLSEKLLSENMKNAEYIKENYIEKDETDKDKHKKTINNIALYGKNDRLIFIESYEERNNIAKDITILKQDKNGNVTAKTTAQEAKWTGTTWVFSNMLIYKLDSEGIVAGEPLFFENKNIDMERPAELIAKGTSYEFMNLKDLSNYIKNFSNSSSDVIRRLKVDLHYKVSFPFMSLIIVLIGASFAIRIRRRTRSAEIMGMGASVAIGLIYYVFMASCIALGKGGVIPPPISAHLANIVFGAFAVFSIKN